MSNLRRHNPALQERLGSLLAAGDFSGLLSCLDGLNATDRRTAGYLLGEVLLPTLDAAAYWDVFAVVVPHDPKAYLGTFLKAGCRLYEGGRLTFGYRAFLRFAATDATVVDRRKTLEAFLPLLRTPEEAIALLDMFGVEPATRVPYLFRAGSRPCYFLLFQQLKALDDALLTRKYCLLLMQRGDRLSFNLASLLKHYFALENIPGTFSLRLEPYEQGRLDTSYEAFDKVLTSI